MPFRFPEPSPDEAAEGKNALVEALAVEQGVDLKGGRALVELRRLNREDGVDNHVSIVIVVGLYVVAIAVMGVFISIVLNKVLPQSYRYLDKDQIDDLYGFILPLVTGFGAGIGRKYIKGSPPREDI